jgi:hypothetical protein
MTQALGPLYGWRVRGYDPNDTMARHQGIMDIQSRQADSIFNREMRKNMGDPKAQEEVRERFREIMIDIERRRKEGR